MNQTRYQHVTEIFQHACDLAGADCALYLDRVCGNDADLRAQVESLLAQDTKASFFDDPIDAGTPIAPGLDPTSEVVRVGRYEIVDEIGHGGMAVVYLAHDVN